MKQNKLYTPYIFIILLLVIDLGSKYIFYDANIGSDIFFITKYLNTGIARSIPVGIAITIPLTILAIVMVWYAFKRKEIASSVFVFFVAGAGGNLIDRIMYQGVRDFINFFDRFIFNFADAYLHVAIIVFAIHTIQEYIDSKKNS